jgi:hypothetical protein
VTLRDDLLGVPFADRDLWVDRLFGIDGLVADGPALPPGCVPYLPAPVDAILRMIDQAGIHADDVFVDIGAGVGRAAVLVHLLTGATAIGIEIQPQLIEAALELRAHVGAAGFSPVLGDAGPLADGTVFFLYCPFGGERLERVLDELEMIARTRPIRVCCLDLPLPPRAWLMPASPLGGDLVIYRSG